MEFTIQELRLIQRSLTSAYLSNPNVDPNDQKIVLELYERITGYYNDLVFENRGQLD